MAPKISECLGRGSSINSTGVLKTFVFWRSLQAAVVPHARVGVPQSNAKLIEPDMLPIASLEFSSATTWLLVASSDGIFIKSMLPSNNLESLWAPCGTPNIAIW